MFKKDDNYNTIANLSYHIISLVIISNNILLSSLVALIYYFIAIRLFSQCTKLCLSIIGYWFIYIKLSKNIPVHYCIIEKHINLLSYYQSYIILL